MDLLHVLDLHDRFLEVLLQVVLQRTHLVVLLLQRLALLLQLFELLPLLLHALSHFFLLALELRLHLLRPPRMAALQALHLFLEFFNLGLVS